jgi:hypothetical protein
MCNKRIQKALIREVITAVPLISVEWDSWISCLRKLLAVRCHLRPSRCRAYWTERLGALLTFEIDEVFNPQSEITLEKGSNGKGCDVDTDATPAVASSIDGSVLDHNDQSCSVGKLVADVRRSNMTSESSRRLIPEEDRKLYLIV